MTDHLIKPTVYAVIAESFALTVALVDQVDIVARIIAAIASVVIAAYMAGRLRAETELAKARKQKEEIETEIKQAELANLYLKNKKEKSSE